MTSTKSNLLSPAVLCSRLNLLILVAADAAALLLSLAISFWLRFDGSSYNLLIKHYLKDHILSLPLILVLYIGAFSFFRLYRYAWRFAGFETLISVVQANTLGLFGMIIVQSLLDGKIFPRSVLIIFWTMSIVSIGAVRMALRSASIMRNSGLKLKRRNDRNHIIRAVVLGTGILAARTLRTLSDDPQLRYKVIGCLDNDPTKTGTYIGKTKVLGTFAMLDRLVAKRIIDEVIVALQDMRGDELRWHILECRKHKIPVKVVPRLYDVLEGKTYLKMEEFTVEDLLRRPPIHTSTEAIGDYLRDKRVLVTGAGGGIGSELCRQILAHCPERLILVGHGENSIFQIHGELHRGFPEMSDRIHWIIGSVSDEFRVSQIFDCFSPEVVFHAAAHKHVPIMESNPIEAVHNNIIGTAHIAEACGTFGVERMVLISTDKAANPSSMMGATKWMCEEVVRAAAASWPKTEYITVRFGNVLGSRGSVVPIFQEQIMRGGPVTVTHPEMTRFFMTIPEAVHLVLQAGAIGRSGELYLLDMGSPVRITDLAKDMIRLCGHEPEVDIPIVFTGIRPGERLHEQLVSDDETIKPAKCTGLFIVERPNHFSPSEVLDLLQRLRHMISYGSENEIFSLLDEIVPGFAERRKKTLVTSLYNEDSINLRIPDGGRFRFSDIEAQENRRAA